MSYDFWVDKNAGGDLVSGCTQDSTPAWTGTVTVSGSTVTKVSGPDFPEAMRDGTHFLRIDPDGASDSNVRIISGGVDSLVIGGLLVIGTAKNAHIGGAFKSPEKAIGTSASSSKIPYSDGAGVSEDINIYIKYGVYSLTGGLWIESSTQDTAKIRRRIIGLKADGSYAGFPNGVFDGPTMELLNTTPITVNAHGISIGGLKLKTDITSSNGILLKSGKYNLFMRHLYFDGGYNGYYGEVGSCANLGECFFDSCDAAIWGSNMAAVRCVADGVNYAWGGNLSSYNCCVEFNTGSNIIYSTEYPGSLDFSYCLFTSNKKPWSKAGCQIVLDHCVLQSDVDVSTLSNDLTFHNCVVGGQYVDQSDKKYRAFPNMHRVIDNAGIDTYNKIFDAAINQEAHYPHPLLDRYCRYSTAGPHEYRFPIEAVGARALRNRQRVTNSEIGL